MSYDRYQYTILCEDLNQYNFVRGWLLERGVHPRGKIRPYGNDDLPHPGSGKEYVRHNLENACKNLRRPPASRVLIAMIDADNLPPEKAEEKYLCFGAAPDKVFFIVPRWSIETWVRWLLDMKHDKACDESNSCKSIYEKEDFTKLGKKLSALMRNASVDDLPPMPASLQRAIVHVIDVSKKLPRA